MELQLSHKSDDQLYTDIFWRILRSVPENTRKEYYFFYEKFLDHLIIDTEYLIKKHMPGHIGKEPYKIEVFKRTYVNHTSGGNSNNFARLLHPERDPELRAKAQKIRRKEKLQKIIKTYGN